MAWLDSLPERVSVYEVSPRDGLQNESILVPLASKLRLIDALAAAGLERIEVGSFVSRRWVPQMGDSLEVCRALAPSPGIRSEATQVGGGAQGDGTRFTALCPNATGLRRAMSVGLEEIAVFLSASESHNRRNINKSIEATLKAFEEVIEPAVRHGMDVRGYVSTVWGCPYEGEVDPRRTLELARELLARGCYQVSLGDTIGAATPLSTRRVLEVLLGELPVSALALHMHDTRGTALANVMVGLEMGITTFDAAVAGLGGCPYAPGAAGNLATEDLVYALEAMGVRTGVDLDRLWHAGQVAEAIVGRPLPGKVHRAGLGQLGLASSSTLAKHGR